jgi:uncharacterized protein (TIGR00106 family)
MVIAQISVVPIGTGSPSVSRYVARFQKELKRLGFKPVLGSMSTVIEAKRIDKILLAVKRLHEKVFEEGAMRAYTSVTIDERRDKEGSISQKMSSVRRQLSKRTARSR